MGPKTHNQVTGLRNRDKPSPFLVLYLGQQEQAQVQMDGNLVTQRDRLRWATLLQGVARSLTAGQLRPGLFPEEPVTTGEWQPPRIVEMEG